MRRAVLGLLCIIDLGTDVVLPNIDASVNLFDG